jgi:glycine/D-amino acid oxidase-like deaminating enzyme
MAERFDVAIIGGGISGCSTAWHLAKRRVSVVLLEQGAIAEEQSRWAWGFVRCQGRHPAEVPLAKAAIEVWSRLAGELQADVEYTRDGILALAETDADEVLLRNGVRIATENGIDSRLVGPDEIKSLVPGIAGPWRLGLYTSQDGHAEPIKATTAFAEAAARLGASLRPHTPVTDLVLRDGAVAGVVTPAGEIEAGCVVCATGVNGTRFARKLGVSIPVRGIRSTVMETKPTARQLTRTAVWGPYVAFRPTLRKTFYLGNGYRGAGGDYDITLGSLRGLSYFLPNYVRNARRVDMKIGPEFLHDLADRIAAPLRGNEIAPMVRKPRLNKRKVDHNRSRFYEMMPELAGLGIQRSWAGRVDLTPDVIPAIGRLRNIRNFVIATGFSGHGFALGPATGRLLSELAMGEAPFADISAFDPHRFASGSVAPYREAL